MNQMSNEKFRIVEVKTIFDGSVYFPQRKGKKNWRYITKTPCSLEKANEIINNLTKPKTKKDGTSDNHADLQ